MVKADHGVQPDDQKQKGLPPRCARPQLQQDVLVNVLVVRNDVEAAVRQDVANKEKRDRQPQSNLGGFPGRHPPRSPRHQLSEREPDVRRERAVEQDRAWP